MILTSEEYTAQLAAYRIDHPSIPIEPDTDPRYYYAGEIALPPGIYVLRFTPGGEPIRFWRQQRRIPIRMSPTEYLDDIIRTVRRMIQHGGDVQTAASAVDTLFEMLDLPESTAPEGA